MKIKISENKKPLVENNLISTELINITDNQENLQVDKNDTKSFITNNFFIRKLALFFKKWNHNQNNTLYSSADNEESLFSIGINHFNCVFLTSFNMFLLVFLGFFRDDKLICVTFGCFALSTAVWGSYYSFKNQNIFMMSFFYFYLLIAPIFLIHAANLHHYPISFDIYNLPTLLFILNFLLLFMKCINCYIYAKKMHESASRKHPSIIYFLLIFFIYVLVLLFGNEGNFFTAYTKYICLTYSIILLWFFFTISDFMPRKIKIDSLITIFLYIMNDFVNPITYFVCQDYQQQGLNNATVVG